MKTLSLITFLSIFSFKIYAQDHGLTLRTPLKYSAQMEAFDYVDTKAPEGGVLKLAAFGTFDHFLPFAQKGVSGEGNFLVYESLLKRSLDEPFAMYGRLARRVDFSEDGLRLVFHLHPHIQFSDGKPLNAEDVVATFKSILKAGRYDLRASLKVIEKVYAKDRQTIVFKLKPGTSKQSALIIGFVPIVSKAELQGASKLMFKGTGPYVLSQMVPGKNLIFKKNPHYWGKDLAINKGFHHFETIAYEYFKDRTLAFEALKAKHVDVLEVSDPLHLQKARQLALKHKQFDMKLLPKKKPLGAFGFVFNVRRPLFQNIFVRQALAHAFDFEAWNKTYYDGKLKRVSGYFMGSPYASKVLEDEPTSHRADLHQCFNLLGLAGYRVYKHHLHHHATQKPLEFELLLSTPNHHKLALYYQANLEKLGIHMRIRTVDPSEYERRRTQFDYDMILHTFEASSEPGEELLKYWGKSASKIGGSYNYAGVSDDTIDRLIQTIVHTKDIKDYQNNVQKLDILLKKGCYMVPLYVYDQEAVILHKKIGIPEVMPLEHFSAVRWWAPLTWWDKSL